jgi:XapX domain-containing protein
MNGYLVSLLMGVVVGAAYGFVQLRSPAPPLIALVGLLGMALGEQAVDLAKRHLAPPAQASVRQEVLLAGRPVEDVRREKYRAGPAFATHAAEGEAASGSVESTR